ncbi:indole-3-glycerol phosphate synthase TrpC [Fictibacillus aquaticus]|uniref:indole-3-glycerol phosphate synthase TrpC n=1 Tax=Fictibacillus aquaticus TaxID=2021314 RepID=UPI00197AE7A3|nr:indole-3-glycerol phosphate synthase TrpC [Fictibacillus aquaticus]
MLTEILNSKQLEVQKLKKTEINSERKAVSGTFIEALQNHRESPALIAEVKKASPSKGIIRHDFQPVKIAKEYEEAGAACLSVLTDGPFFQGSLHYLEEIRKNTSLPLLRKDFIIDERQIEESVIYGADAILLIAAAMPAERLRLLYEHAESSGLDVLVEVHSLEELKSVTAEFSPSLIGINNRDLNTFHTDLATTFSLLPHMPEGVLIVSESGIVSSDDVSRLKASGVGAMLVGETLMRSENINSAVSSLYGYAD